MAKIILATGGTGGHIFPALAVADELKTRGLKDLQLIFMGGKYGQEKSLVPKSGYNIMLLPVKGILGKGLNSASNIVLVFFSMFKGYLFLRRFKPDIVMGFGGYASFVPVFLATKMGISTCIHEQNSFPGFTNRFLGKRVDKIFLSFPDTRGVFPRHRTLVVGNPVRADFLRESEGENGHIEGANKRMNLLVVGGSQGAKGINDIIIDSLTIFKKLGVRIYHQTGSMDYERVCQAYVANNMKEFKVEPFISNMAKAYRWADLVVCRAGASTIFELAVMGKPSVLIPYPYAANNHQRVNAKFLEQGGGAIVLEQSYLKNNRLGSVVADLIAIPGRLKQMSKAVKKLARPDATKRIVDVLIEMLNITLNSA